MFWLVISHANGNSVEGLLKSVEEGLFAIVPNYKGAHVTQMLNDGKTCFMKPFDRDNVPSPIFEYFNSIR